MKNILLSRRCVVAFSVWLPTLLLHTETFSQAQTQKKMRYTAQVLEGKKIKGEPARLLKGAVRLHQEALVIYCDSALFFHERNFVEAHHHVKIVNENDTIQSERLYYDGTKKEASFYENVRYSGNNNTLHTEHLDYLVQEKIAHYQASGTLVDSLNTLQSKEGYYYSAKKEAVFYGNVLLTHPAYTLRTEALRYHTSTRVAVLEAKGVLDTDDMRVYAERGSVDTQKQQAQLQQALMIDAEHILCGRYLSINTQADYHVARENVSFEVRGKDLTFFGNYGEYDAKNGCSFMEQQPFMQKILADDVLYLRADKFVVQQRDGKRYAYAYPHVQLHSKKLTGKAGFIRYVPADSIVFVREDPIFWHGEKQVTAKNVDITLRGDNIHTIHFDQEAFSISKNEVAYFNQSKSTQMMAYFSQGTLEKIEANGNGESIYFVVEDDGTLTGMNTLSCGKMTMYVSEEEIESMHFYLSPQGTFTPPNLLTEENTQLAGFAWRIEEKPMKEVFYDVKTAYKAKMYETYGIRSVAEKTAAEKTEHE